MTENEIVKTDETKVLATRLSEIDPLLLRQLQRDQTVKCLRQLMANLKMDADTAILVLQIPKKERAAYRSILTHNKKTP